MKLKMKTTKEYLCCNGLRRVVRKRLTKTKTFIHTNWVYSYNFFYIDLDILRNELIHV